MESTLMANWFEPTKRQMAAWRKWVALRPPAIRAVAENFQPWGLYRMADTGSRVTIRSFDESDPVTVTVNVLGEFNLVAFERFVFGVNPEDLTPCDLPTPGDPVGVMMSEEEADEFIDSVRLENGLSDRPLN